MSPDLFNQTGYQHKSLCSCDIGYEFYTTGHYCPIHNPIITKIFKIHPHESNPKSSPFLEANRKKFSKQLQQVYDLLIEGNVLTNLKVINEYCIGSITSRISELRKQKVELTDEIKTVAGQPRYKVWYCTEAQIQANIARFVGSPAKEEIIQPKQNL